MTGHFNLALIPPQAEQYFEANRHVLVIEDDRILNDMIVETLADVGFATTRATSGIMALEKIRQQPVDFILLDLLLPGMDGFETYRRLQGDPQTRHIPVMIITAWSDEWNLQKATDLGIQHVLAKPFTEDELLASILTLLVNKSGQSH